jgi:flagellar biosynthesis protein FlhG
MRESVHEMIEGLRLERKGKINGCPFLKFPRIISVSGKGGVGKTNLVTNLAFAFARLNKNVFVLDGDLRLPNIHTLLGLVPKYTINHFLRGEEIPWKFTLEEKGGIIILPGSCEGSEFVNLGAREKLNLIDKIELLKEGADIILIDTESGLSSNVLFFNQMASNNIIIITPEPTSINNAQALIKTLSSKDKKRKFAILVNLALNKGEAIHIFDNFAEIIDNALGHIAAIEFLGFLPFDKKLQKAIRSQHAVIEMWPQASSSCSIMEIARTILERTPSHTEGNGNFLAFSPIPKASLLTINRVDDGAKSLI